MDLHHMRQLDQLLAHALRLLGEAEAVEGQTEWEREVRALRDGYRDLQLSYDDDPNRSPARVDVRRIVGEVLLADATVHRLYHSDPAMRHGVEIVMGTLGTVADVLVREGETVLYAGHLIELTAQELQKAHNAHVDTAALATANVEMFGPHPLAPTPGDLS